MIDGPCPYCGECNMNEFVYEASCGKVQCDECEEWYIITYSTFRPRAYKLENVIIDEENKTVQFKKAD